MKKLPKIQNFDAFILNESRTQRERESTIADAVSKVKEKYGKTPQDFLKSARENGVDDVKDFIVKTVEPYIARIESQELFQNNAFDFDGLMSGLVSWIIVELELDKMKKETSK